MTEKIFRNTSRSKEFSVKHFELSFLQIFLLREDIAEVIVNEKVELNSRMVKEYHEFLLTHLSSPFSLLINKKNNYTYSDEAQQALGSLNELNSLSFLVYDEIAELSIKSLAVGMPRQEPWNMQIFTKRDEALAWLVSEQNKLTAD